MSRIALIKIKFFVHVSAEASGNVKFSYLFQVFMVDRYSYWLKKCHEEKMCSF